MRIHCLLVVMLLAGASSAQSAQANHPSEPLTADAIMARVAVNQDRSEELRKQFVYRQHMHIVTHKPKGRLLREETTDYDVTPMPDGTQKQLKLLTGRYWTKANTRSSRASPRLVRTVSTAV